MVKQKIKSAFNLTENFIRYGRNEIFEIMRIIKNRKFHGNRGVVIKNSFFQLLNNGVSKIGSLIFTIIIARLLLPELFGLYSLALATIIIFAGFSDLGIGTTIVKFVSEAMGRNNKTEAKKYALYLGKIKLVLLLISAATLAICADFIANTYYHKPIFFALVAGSAYIVISGVVGIVDVFFQANNNFKRGVAKEAIYQISRLILVPLAIIFGISKSSDELVVTLIILALALSFLMGGIFIYIKSKRELGFLKVKDEPISDKEKNKINKFLILVSTTIFSGIFLGYIDTIILGRYVSTEYIGYYQAALTIIGSVFPLIPLSAVLLPIFSRLSGKRLEAGFSRSLRFTAFMSTILFFLTLLFSDIVIWLVYGQHYEPSTLILKILALNIFFIPLNSIYDSYFVSVGKPQIMAKYLIISTILNIVLNYVLIKSLIAYSEYYALVGSAMAVVISRAFYLLMQSISKRKIQ